MPKKSWPSSPLELLQARYQAHVKADVDFIVASTHPEMRDKLDQGVIQNWCKQATWLGYHVEEESVEGDSAFITFLLRYEEANKPVNHYERAEFRQHEGKWHYYDSSFPKPKTIKREEPKLGRNDPCACGSGKKFKKCCG